MSAQNSEIAEAFYRLASMLEIEGANPFRVRAYRNAARTIETLPESAAAMLARGGDFSELPGIGKDLAGKIAEMIRTGRLGALEEEERHLPRALVELTTVPGLGPKRIKLLHDKLGIASPKALAEAVMTGRLEGLPNFGPKLVAKLREGLARHGTLPQRTPLARAEDVAAALVENLEAAAGVETVTVAGSFRRRKETVGDLDLVASARGGEAMRRFVSFPEVAEVMAEGETRSTVRLRSGLQVDLRVVPAASYGAALLYFTGSKAHCIKLRAMAMKRGLKLNEYGLFKASRKIAAPDETAIYRRLGLPYIEPELREDQGEIEAARAGRLPRLVTLADLRGELHAHTKATDGRNSIAEMAASAQARGYAYLAISDHSRHMTAAHGLDSRRLARQLAEIERLNEGYAGFRLLKSVEVDILEDGRLDLPDEILARLDLVIGAIHSRFDLDPAKQTARILRAMDNRRLDILAHPTGRLINQRAPYEINMERVVEAARARGCFLELNAQPDRLDLCDADARLAKEAGVKLAIATDAHGTGDLALMRFGIDQARRAWLGPEDVLNTRSWPELRRLLRGR
jgi:DNA polymerase (family 10)